jgi:hypothetical protein
LEHYITLFDSLFAPQGLALHASLKRHAGPFTLWVLCMDEEIKVRLDALGEPTMRTVALADVETPGLLEVKPGRSRPEYCWTLTPFTPKIVFDRDPTAVRATYIDADVFLLKSPRPIFEEFEASGKAVLMTDHAYDPEYDQSALSGQYCVQFVTFVRNASEPVRHWWQERCVEWCFARVEDGKLGDQKYLDEWPIRFADRVHVLKQLDVLLAPWNARRFPYSRAIAWHFHSLRLLPNRRVLLHSGYAVPAVVDRAIYLPYIEQLGRSLEVLGMPIVQKVHNRGRIQLLKSFVKNLLMLLRNLGEHDAIRRLPK